jgi:drug/metabolite transporter (DMT)-like permease
VILLEWWKGRRSRPGLRVISGLLAGVVGVATLVLSRQTGSAVVNPGAALLLVLASLAWASGTMRASAQKQTDALRTSAVQLLTGALILLPVSAALGEFTTVVNNVPSVRSLIALAYLVIFGSLVGYSAFVWLLQQVPASRVASHSYVNPLIAVLLGGWLMNEPMDVATLAAAVLIIGSVVAIVTDRTGTRATTEAKDRATVPARPIKAA